MKMVRIYVLYQHRGGNLKIKAKYVMVSIR